MHPHQYKITGGDETYTLSTLITPLIPFIENFMKNKGINNLTIWCPFDTKENVKYGDIIIPKSEYVKVFEEQGYNVIATHITTGQDFFEYEPTEHYDIIISNSPFKNKAKFFKRAIELNKPFAILNTASWLK